MTALDDALNSSSVVWGPHQLTALWREIDNGDLATNPDSVSNLTPQSSGAFTVNHSLDDGLPDDVTMSTSSDASGILQAGMIGREGLALATRGVRTFNASCTSSGTAVLTFNGTIPDTAVRGDFLVCAFVIDDATASIVQVNSDPKYSWDYLGSVSDSTIGLYVYATRRYYPGRPPIMIEADRPVNYVCSTVGFWATNPQGIPMDHRVTDAQVIAEGASSVTSHSVSSTLYNRGAQLVFWGAAAASGVWTPAAPTTLLGSPSITNLRLTSAITGLIESGNSTATATSAVATNLGTYASLSVEPYERPRMSAVQYFSPFNTQSPVYGYERDTATVSASIRTLTDSGPVDTSIFSGQMQDIPIDKGDVAVTGVSKTRIRMNRSVTIPVVGALREGLTADWFATWLMAQGSQFVGPAPNRYTRFWAPMHGSVHPHWGAPTAYGAAYYLSTADPFALYGTKYPTWVKGPYNLGMFAQQSSSRTDSIQMVARDLYKMTDSPFPHVTEAGGPLLNDLFSQANGKARLGMYLRGDAVSAAPSYLDPSDDFIFDWLYICIDLYNNYVGYIHWWIDPATRLVNLDMGSDRYGSTKLAFSTAGALPTNGSWNYVGLYWDFAAGSASVNMNGTIQTSTTWATNARNGIDQLAPDDVQAQARGDRISCTMQWHVPMSEVVFNTGETYSAGVWSDQYVASGTVTFPGQTATMRNTGQGLVALAEATSLNVWDTLTKLAQSCLCAFRVNEADAIEFLPLSYFGETAQMTPVSVQDTRTNTAEISPSTDPSKTRNVVTVQFDDTRIDSSPQVVLSWTTAVEIPPGTSTIQFPLDVPTVELHGASNLTGSAYSIINLTSTQINTPTLPKDHHYITVLQKPDGTGLVYSEVQVSAEFVQVTGQSVTIKFVNRLPNIVYLSNAADQVPFLQVLGYGVRSTDGYSTARDAASVTLRGERGLDAQLDWVQDRIAARDLAATLLGILARPRAQVELTVRADPRRKPGQMIVVQDSDGTMVAGNWRVLTVAHQVAGPEYVQTLSAYQVLPAAVWDGVDGWDEAVWS